MKEELLPKEDEAVCYQPAVPVGLQQEVIIEGEVLKSENISSSLAGSTISPARRTSLASRYRKKSRRMTLTQVCSEDTLHHSISSPVLVGRDEAAHAVPESAQQSSTDDDRISSSSGTISTTSSVIATPERKISRIFSMLQSMQNTFFQQQQPTAFVPQQQAPPHLIHQEQMLQRQLSSHQPAVMYPRSPSVASSNAAQHSTDGYKVNSIRRHQPSLYGLGSSSDSFVLASGGVSPVTTLSRPISRPMLMERNMRLGSVNSWTGSQCSGFSGSTVSSEGPPPPLIHAMPYHKDGW